MYSGVEDIRGNVYVIIQVCFALTITKLRCHCAFLYDIRRPTGECEVFSNISDLLKLSHWENVIHFVRFSTAQKLAILVSRNEYILTLFNAQVFGVSHLRV